MLALLILLIVLAHRLQTWYIAILYFDPPSLCRPSLCVPVHASGLGLLAKCRQTMALNRKFNRTGLSGDGHGSSVKGDAGTQCAGL